ncbi:MAG: glycosyltransferase family 4 protein [Gemmatimonadota bacterium]
MRVVHVVTAFPRSDDDVITPWLVKLIAAQRESGLDASVLAPAYRGLGARTVLGVPVRRFRYAPRPCETLTHDETVPDRLRRSPAYASLIPLYLAGGVRAGRRVGREAPDVVHVHWPVPHALIGAAARSASNGRSALVCTFYSVEIRWIEHRLRWLRPLLRWSIRTADAVTAISSETAARVRRLAEREVAVIPFSGAVWGENALVARESGRVEGPLRLLFVGRLVERKGVEYLVEALQHIRRERPAELTIVGEGEWGPVIRREVERLRLESHVRFTGYVPERRLREYYQTCDIFVLPAVVDSKGDTEGLGVVLLEALRFERPVIGSAVGGIPDIVRPGETGWLVPPGDPEAIAGAALEIAGDPGSALGIARKGRRFVEERFSLERVVAELTDVYRSAIRARRETRG